MQVLYGYLGKIIFDAYVEDLLALHFDKFLAILAKILEFTLQTICFVFDDHPHDLALLRKKVPFTILQSNYGLFRHLFILGDVFGVLEVVYLLQRFELNLLEMLFNCCNQIALHLVKLIFELLSKIINETLYLHLKYFLHLRNFYADY